MGAYEEFMLHLCVSLLVQDNSGYDEEIVESLTKINRAELEDLHLQVTKYIFRSVTNARVSSSPPKRNLSAEYQKRH